MWKSIETIIGEQILFNKIYNFLALTWNKILPSHISSNVIYSTKIHKTFFCLKANKF